MKISDEYHIWYEENRIWETTKWLGVPMWKLPMDAFIIQDIICKVNPDYILELGSGCGGSSIFYASIFQMLGHGQVITVDSDDSKLQLDKCTNKTILSRVKFVKGNSTSSEVYYNVFPKLKEKRNIVILDSWHSYDHVLNEMNMYKDFVSRESYMIVEDTHVSNHPIKWDYGKGPYEAVEDFLKMNDSFEVDTNCERLGCTFNPNGYLKKVKGEY